MSGRISAAMQNAVSTWRKGTSVYSHAAAHKVDPSALYRALIRMGKKKKRNGA